MANIQDGVGRLATALGTLRCPPPLTAAADCRRCCRGCRGRGCGESCLAESLCNFSTPLGQESTLTALAAPVETTREDIIRSLRARAQALGHGAEAHPREVIIFRELRNMTDEQAGVFLARLKEITRDFEAFKSQVDADTHTRALTIAFYPSFYYDQTVSEISADQTG